MQRVWWVIALTTLVLIIAAWFQEESYITSLLTAVTWPLVILAVVLIFKDPLKKKLEELSSADIQGNRLEFQRYVAKHVNQAKQFAEKIEPVKATDNGEGDVRPQYAGLLDRASELVEKQPKESIAASFEPVKQMILDAAEKSGVVVVPSASVHEVLDHLPVDIDENAVKAVEQLEAARKDAFRLDGPLPKDAARSYVEAAQTVAKILTPKISEVNG